MNIDIPYDAIHEIRRGSENVKTFLKSPFGTHGERHGCVCIRRKTLNEWGCLGLRNSPWFLCTFTVIGNPRFIRIGVITHMSLTTAVGNASM